MDEFMSGETIDYLTDPSRHEPTLDWIPRVENVLTVEAVCNGTIDTKHERRRMESEYFELEFE